MCNFDQQTHGKCIRKVVNFVKKVLIFHLKRAMNPIYKVANIIQQLRIAWANLATTKWRLTNVLRTAFQKIVQHNLCLYLFAWVQPKIQGFFFEGRSSPSYVINKNDIMKSYDEDLDQFILQTQT